MLYLQTFVYIVRLVNRNTSTYECTYGTTSPLQNYDEFMEVMSQFKLGVRYLFQRWLFLVRLLQGNKPQDRARRCPVLRAHLLRTRCESYMVSVNSDMSHQV